MAAVTSGSVYSSYGDESRLYVDWQQTGQSIENNETYIKYQIGIQNGNYWYNNAVRIDSVYINGSKVFGPKTYSNITTQGKVKKVDGTATIKHGSDGKKTFKISIDGWFFDGIDVEGSKNFELTPIPRVSDLTIDLDTVPADGKSKIIATVDKKAAAFTDVLTVSLGDYTQALTSGTAFTIPKEWNNAIAGTSAVATVKVETFNGETSIGSKTADLTVTVPASVVPTINGIAISEAVASVKSAFGGLYVQNLSQINVTIDASGTYGSTIRSYSATLDGVNYIQQAFTSNVIKTAGALEIAVKVTDSRGRSATESISVDIVEYVLPTITSMVYEHSGDDSTKVTIAGRVSSVSGKNTKALKLKYKSMADETYTERAVTLSDWTFSVDVTINNTDPTVTYEYIAELTDKINASTPETFKVTTGIVVMSRLAGGKGVTMFGEAKEEGFIVEGSKPAKFTGDVTLNSIKSDGTLIANTPIKIINTTDADGLTAKNVPLYIGADNGNHIEIDTNEIMAKATDTTTTHLYLNSNGGNVHVCKDGNGDFYIKNAKVADCVVEYGTSGIWEYRKWNSGLAECWGTTPSVATGTLTKSGSIYYKADLKVATVPTDLFTEVEFVMGTQVSANTVGWLCQARHSSGDIYVTYDREQSSATSIVVAVKVKGRWK